MYISILIIMFSSDYVPILNLVVFSQFFYELRMKVMDEWLEFLQIGSKYSMIKAFEIPFLLAIRDRKDPF